MQPVVEDVAAERLAMTEAARWEIPDLQRPMGIARGNHPAVRPGFHRVDGVVHPFPIPSRDQELDVNASKRFGVGIFDRGRHVVASSNPGFNR